MEQEIVTAENSKSSLCLVSHKETVFRAA